MVILPPSCSVGTTILDPHETGTLGNPIQCPARGAGLRPDSLSWSWPLSREPTLARTVSPGLSHPSRSQKAAYLLPLGSPGLCFPQSWKERRDPPQKECGFEPGQNWGEFLRFRPCPLHLNQGLRDHWCLDCGAVVERIAIGVNQAGWDLS